MDCIGPPARKAGRNQGMVIKILVILESLGNIESVIQYDIYGPVKDAGYWDECLTKIKLLPHNIKVTAHKEIDPSKVKEVLTGAHVFILPSKSENFGHAIYEALSAGRPVITSNHTPWNHLQESRAGTNVSLEDNVELTDAINFFVAMNEPTLMQWQQGAINYAARAIDMEKIRRQYREMFLSSPSPLERAG